MTAAPLVGIIGASGAVGREAARLLVGTSGISVRVGARRVASLHALASATPNAPVQIAAVDVDDPRTLAAFCADCRVVINCAGPSFRILDLVARAAFSAGADYVDPGGDWPLYERLVQTPPAGGRTALVTAGMMPGLSGWLPRWLARQGFDRTNRLTAYVGGRGRLTDGTAGDYVLSLGHDRGDALAAWRHGGRVARALEPLIDVELPFFPGRVTAQPFLSRETESVARDLGLADVSWYNVFEGRHLLDALRRLRPTDSSPEALATAVGDLSKAADLDLFGHDPYQLLVFTLQGEAAGQPLRRMLVVRATEAQAISGTVAMLAAMAIVDGAVGPGVFFADQALPVSLVDRLRDMPAVTRMDLVDHAAETIAAIDEGAV